ncbi:MAG: FAD-binding domain-containing protein [Bacteroidota bacterium]
MIKSSSKTFTFSTELEDILDQVEQIDPVRYGKSRNFKDGAVTRLSPYISRGVISTKYVFKSLMDRGYKHWEIEKMIQELAWRDYWQQAWIEKGDEINEDLRQEQPEVENFEMPQAILSAETGIEAVDEAIEEFYQSGYLHNHMRMYIAAIACNMGHSHWKEPARWMYYHLLDGDWASNALSWQWVAGANSNKKYVANQENINKYWKSRQRGTFLDIAYDEFQFMETPSVLAESIIPDLKTSFPQSEDLQIDPAKPSLIYNWYNLDPFWKEHAQANRILLLEPSHFEAYPISEKSMNFMLRLGDNIPGLQVYVGEFWELVKDYGIEDIYFKEHPLNGHYQGTEESRDWMFGVKGYYRSFFGFWKHCQKELKHL